MTVQQKLHGSSGALIALAAVGLLGAISSAWMTNAMSSDMNHTVNHTARTSDALREFDHPLDSVRILSRGLVVYALLRKPEIVDQQIEKIEAASKQTKDALVHIQSLLQTPVEQASFVEVSSTLDRWFDLTKRVEALARAGKGEETATEAQKNLREYAAVLDKAETDLSTVERGDLEAMAQRSALLRSWSRWLAGFSIPLTLIAATAAGWLVRQVNVQLRATVLKVSTVAENVHAGSTQISAAAAELAGSASEQAAHLEETSAATEEVASVSRANSTHSSEAASLVSEVGSSLLEGNQSVGAMVLSMDEIGASSDKVSKIMRVIDEIAFQTNILAVNAAVEAARAKEEGLGFAVVAGEVRTLAQRSADAARDTTALIEESLSKTKGGRVCVDQVAAVFRVISTKANRLGTLVQEVKTGNEQQGSSMAQIAGAMGNMNQSTQAMAASAEETASASAEMTSQAEMLREVSSFLISMVG